MTVSADLITNIRDDLAQAIGASSVKQHICDSYAFSQFIEATSTEGRSKIIGIVKALFMALYEFKALKPLTRSMHVYRQMIQTHSIREKSFWKGLLIGCISAFGITILKIAFLFISLIPKVNISSSFSRLFFHTYFTYKAITLKKETTYSYRQKCASVEYWRSNLVRECVKKIKTRDFSSFSKIHLEACLNAVNQVTEEIEGNNYSCLDKNIDLAELIKKEKIEENFHTVSTDLFLQLFEKMHKMYLEEKWASKEDIASFTVYDSAAKSIILEFVWNHIQSEKQTTSGDTRSIANVNRVISKKKRFLFFTKTVSSEYYQKEKKNFLGSPLFEEEFQNDISTLSNHLKQLEQFEWNSMQKGENAPSKAEYLSYFFLFFSPWGEKKSKSLNLNSIHIRYKEADQKTKNEFDEIKNKVNSICDHLHKDYIQRLINNSSIWVGADSKKIEQIFYQESVPFFDELLKI